MGDNCSTLDPRLLVNDCRSDVSPVNNSDDSREDLNTFKNSPGETRNISIFANLRVFPNRLVRFEGSVIALFIHEKSKIDHSNSYIFGQYLHRFVFVALRTMVRVAENRDFPKNCINKSCLDREKSR